MSLIDDVFSSLKKANQNALIPFLTADFPNRKMFNYFLHGLPDAGASIIEIGIPFSDPMADGVVIQRASEIAIKNGFNLSQLFEDVTLFKNKFPFTPIVLMTYLNPLIHYGMDLFLTDAKRAGVDGLLVVDLPPESHQKVIKSSHEISMIRLITPTTNDTRLTLINQSASGFIYYVSVKGITGTQRPDLRSIVSHLDLIKTNISLPMVIGFGIDSVESATAMARLSDGIVIGSRLIQPLLDVPSSKYKDQILTQLSFLNDIHLAINND
ncbi:MAG: tryptophan synthase subunit alpha [Candidatus Margulisiibacteriota bacterium]